MTNANALTSQVELARNGDTAAFTRLVEHTQNLVTSVALAIVHDVRASEDIAQEVYAQVWQKLSQLKQPASFLPWLRQTTRHCAYQWLEKEKHNHRSRQQPLDDELATLVAQHSPDEDMSQQQRGKLLSAALTKLPDDSRDIVVLYYREQQSTAHVAELLELDPTTVRQRLSRARKLLADDLMGRFGKAALLTAPSLSISAILGSAAMVAAPPAAAATGLSVSSSLAGMAKWITVVGVTAIGLFAALSGLFIGAHQAQKKAKTAAAKQQIVTLRNRAAWFLVLFGSLFFASYEIDSGWMLPVITYCMLVAGLLYYQVCVNRHVPQDKATRWTCYLGSLLGFAAGFVGLFAGLVASGRF